MPSLVEHFHQGADAFPRALAIMVVQGTPNLAMNAAGTYTVAVAADGRTKYTGVEFQTNHSNIIVCILHADAASYSRLVQNDNVRSAAASSLHAAVRSAAAALQPAAVELRCRSF